MVVARVEKARKLKTKGNKSKHKTAKSKKTIGKYEGNAYPHKTCHNWKKTKKLQAYFPVR